jgi:hypothetical protein
MMTSVERIEQADGRRNLDSRSEGVPAVFGKALSFDQLARERASAGRMSLVMDRSVGD